MAEPLNAAGDAVVVTGWGAVGAQGLGPEPLAAALAAGTLQASPIEPPAGLPPRRGRPAGRAARVVAETFEPWLSRREARRMSPPSRFAVAAGRMALAAAGLDPAPAAADPRTGVALATTYGASSVTQRMLDQLIDEGPEALSPFLFMESVTNAPAGQVAIHCAAAGPNLTLCQREAGPPAALARAAAEVRGGRAGRMLAGAVEEMTPLLFAVLDRCGSVSALPRPFDRRRDGFLAAEGATLFLLEGAAAARERGARALARVTAWGGMFDPAAPRNDWGTDGERVAAALHRGLARHGLGPEDVDAVVSGASGARRGDRLEALALRRLFAGRTPPVLAPKGVTGEYAGAYLGAALLALTGAPFAATAGFAEADPELGVTPHAGGALPPLRRVLVTGLAAGGGGAWVILETPVAPPTDR